MKKLKEPQGLIKTMFDRVDKIKMMSKSLEERNQVSSHAQAKARDNVHSAMERLQLNQKSPEAIVAAIQALVEFVDVI